jgi:Na+-translocating ferredoxin:NAD+ oxidoreductase RnfE subunit
MKTKQIPLIVMLTAGAVTSISTRLMHYELETSLWILLGVLVVFYIIGCVLKHTIDSFELANQAPEDESENEGEGVSDEGEVIEKEVSEAAAGEEKG